MIYETDRMLLDRLADKYPKSTIHTTSPWGGVIGFVPKDWDGSTVHGYAHLHDAPEAERDALELIDLREIR